MNYLFLCVSLQFLVSAWSATIPPATSPGFMNFTTLIDVIDIISNTTSAPPSGNSAVRSETRCQLKEVAVCSYSLAPSFYAALSTKSSEDSRVEFCRIESRYESCAAPYKGNCSLIDTLAYDFFSGLAKYLCSQKGYNEYIDLLSCISNNYLVYEMNRCGYRLSPLVAPDLCVMSDNFTSCIVEASRSFCDTNSQVKLGNALWNILLPVRKATCQGHSSIIDTTTPPASSIAVDNSASSLDITPSQLALGDISTTSIDDLRLQASSHVLSTILPVSVTPEGSYDLVKTAAPSVALGRAEFTTLMPSAVSFELVTAQSSSTVTLGGEESSLIVADVTTKESLQATEANSAKEGDVFLATAEIFSEASSVAMLVTTAVYPSSVERSTTSDVSTSQLFKGDITSLAPAETTQQIHLLDESTAVSAISPTESVLQSVYASSQQLIQASSKTLPDFTTQISQEELSTSSREIAHKHTPLSSELLPEGFTTAAPKIATQIFPQESSSAYSKIVPTQMLLQEATTFSPEIQPTQAVSQEISASIQPFSHLVSTSSLDVITQAPVQYVSPSASEIQPTELFPREFFTGSEIIQPTQSLNQQFSTKSDLLVTEISTITSETTTKSSADLKQVSPSQPISREFATSTQLPTEFSTTAPDIATQTSTTAPDIATQTTTTAPDIATQTSTTAPDIATQATTQQFPSMPTTQTLPVERDFQKSPLKCYECHSGAPGSWQNINCPASGDIQGWAAEPVSCRGPCVSVVTKNPKGEVYRACSKNYYFPNRAPLEGCMKHDGDIFCFCSTDNCNNRDMQKEQEAYVKGTNINV